jgi:hypothetical protein
MGWATSRSRHVWFDSGYTDNRCFLDVPALVDPTKPVVTLEDRKICPHGAAFIHDIPRCGFCLGERSGTTADESFDLFMKSLYDVAKRVAHMSKFDSAVGKDSKMGYKDRLSECLALLLNPKNLQKIAEAKVPMAMATTIAKRRLNNVYRDPFYSQTTALSQFDKRDNDGKLLSEEDKFNDIYGEAFEEGRYSSSSREDNVIDDLTETTFPGFALLWTRENIRRLTILMNEGLDRLERRPYSHALMIKMRYGIIGGGDYTWGELAKHASSSCGKNITTDQVRYAVEMGKASILAYIFKTEADKFEEVIR